MPEDTPAGPDLATPEERAEYMTGRLQPDQDAMAYEPEDGAEEYGSEGVYEDEDEYAYDEDDDDETIYVDTDGSEYVLTEDGYEPLEEDDDDAQWNAIALRGLYDLDSRLGRRLTQGEIDGVLDRIEQQDFPDVEDAYATYQAAGGKAPDVDTSSGRVDYMRERLLEMQREAPDGDEW